MKSLSVYDRRLLKLADHLVGGSLAHKEFDFNYFNFTKNGAAPLGRNCETSGCAIGEMPAIWPERFRWKGNGVVTTEGRTVVDVFTREAMPFFNLNSREAEYLFYPKPDGYLSSDQLDTKATKEAVAARIYHFVRSGRRTVAGNKLAE